MSTCRESGALIEDAPIEHPIATIAQSIISNSYGPVVGHTATSTDVTPSWSKGIKRKKKLHTVDGQQEDAIEAPPRKRSRMNASPPSVYIEPGCGSPAPLENWIDPEVDQTIAFAPETFNARTSLSNGREEPILPPLDLPLEDEGPAGPILPRPPMNVNPPIWAEVCALSYLHSLLSY